MRWGYPTGWWLLALPILAVGLIVYGHLVRRHLTRTLSHHGVVERLLSSLSLERRLLKQLLFVLGLTALTIGALRPQFGRRPEALREAGIDVAIAFDISKSMLAQDVQPSRLDGARAQLAELLSQLTGDRVALVPFAGVAFTQTPLTADRGAIRRYLRMLTPRTMPIGGTNLAMAIEQGVELLIGGDGQPGAEPPKDGKRPAPSASAAPAGRSRALLLITDGEDVATDQGEAVRAAARRAAEHGVRVYAIAVGTRLGEPIPILNEDGSHAGYQRDRQGQPIYSKLNMTLLEELVTLADPGASGEQRVWHFDGGRTVAGSVAASLGKLQRSAVESALRERYSEQFQPFLLVGLLLLLGELLLGERRAPREKVA